MVGCLSNGLDLDCDDPSVMTELHFNKQRWRVRFDGYLQIIKGGLRRSGQCEDSDNKAVLVNLISKRSHKPAPIDAD